MPVLPPPVRVRSLDPAITIFSRPFTRSNLAEIGARMSVVVMRDGGLFVFAPTRLDAPTRGKIAELGAGRVRYVVCPDVEHHLFAGEYQKEWPEAKLVGVDGLQRKREDLDFATVFTGRGESVEAVGYEEEFDRVYFSAHANRDVAFLHKPTKTLFQADLLFNLPPNEQYAQLNGHWSFGQRMLHRLLAGRSLCQALIIRFAFSSNLSVMKEDAEKVLKWDFKRIVPCHGDVIEQDAKDVWRSAYRWVLD